MSHEHLSREKRGEQIAQTFQRWLLACILVAYFITSVFNFFLQNGIAKIETQELFTTAINDVQTDIRGKSDDYMLSIVKSIVECYEEDHMVSLDALAEEYNVIEINIVADDGLITNSTDDTLTGKFNMNSTEQFRNMLDEFVVDVTKNRHVSTNGFIVVCDENLNLITETAGSREHISSIGIIPNMEMNSREPSKSLCKAEIMNEETGYREDYNYVFTFVEGYCIIAAMPEFDVMFMRDASLYTSMFMQVLIFTFLFIVIYILIKNWK